MNEELKELLSKLNNLTSEQRNEMLMEMAINGDIPGKWEGNLDENEINAIELNENEVKAVEGLVKLKNENEKKYRYRS